MRRFRSSIVFFCALVLLHTIRQGFVDLAFGLPRAVWLFAKRKLMSADSSKPQQPIASIETDETSGQEYVRLGSQRFSTSEIFEAYRMALEIRMREMRKRPKRL